jgi:putative tryptophan/tyrosine transport system substrate-binding protein
MKQLRIISAIIALVVFGVLASVLWDVRNKHSQYVVGVFQYAQHQVIREISEGFRDRLDAEASRRSKTIQYVVKNADGNTAQANAIATFFRTADTDIVFVIGVPAAQSLKAAGVEKPVIFGGPPDPVAAGLVPRLIEHGTNFTGTKYFPSQDATIRVLQLVRPKAKYIAVLYNPGEANSAALVKDFTRVARVAGLRVQLYGVSNTAELEAGLREVVGSHPDAVFLPTDNFIYSALDRIVHECSEARIEVFSCTRTSVEHGALFAVGADYRQVGQMTADLAARILFDHVPVQEVNVEEVHQGIVYVHDNVKITPPSGYQVVRVHD